MSSTTSETKTMKALHYDGPFKTSIKSIPRPKIEHPDDIILRVTTAAICGSDLHMYQGRTAAEAGLVFGHENMGIVDELGEGVSLLKKGDRVVIPFNVADGRVSLAEVISFSGKRFEGPWCRALCRIGLVTRNDRRVYVALG